MTKSNIIVWVGLVAFTLLTFYASESLFSGTQLVLILMGIVMVKFLGIGFQFIELKNAHTAWKVLFTGFILFFSLLVVFFS
jgi:cytochrome c oxidase subunit IV